jgi:hypothetical protein
VIAANPKAFAQMVTLLSPFRGTMTRGRKAATAGAGEPSDVALGRTPRGYTWLYCVSWGMTMSIYRNFDREPSNDMHARPIKREEPPKPTR